MKTRTGFVSNSSSSSFIAVVTVPAFKAALEQLKDERDAKIIKTIAKDEMCFGIKAKTIKEFTDAGGFSSIWGCDSDDEEEILEKAGVVWPSVDENGDEIDDEEWCPQDAVYNYTSVLDEMSKKTEWKNQIYQADVGDDG